MVTIFNITSTQCASELLGLLIVVVKLTTERGGGISSLKLSPKEECVLIEYAYSVAYAKCYTLVAKHEYDLNMLTHWLEEKLNM